MDKDDKIARTSKKPSDGFLKFNKAMDGIANKPSFILNCHLISEFFLDQIIHTSLPRADILLDEGNFTYSNKLLLVKALDVVDDKVIASLKSLNKIRNTCSHELDHQITESEIDQIGRPFGKEYLISKKERSEYLLKYTLMRTIARLERDYEKILNDESQKQEHSTNSSKN